MSQQHAVWDGGYKLFVGGLPEDVTQEEMAQVFSTYGKVNNVHMLSRSKRKDNLTACFVILEDKEAAEDAIKVCHNIYKIREDAEKPILVQWAFDLNSDKDLYKLFVGNIPEDVTEWEVEQVFKTYGEVGKVHFAASTRSDGMKAALVMYKDLEGAEDAIQVLNQVYKIRSDAELPLTVKWANEDPKKYHRKEDEKTGWDTGGYHEKSKSYNDKSTDRRNDRSYSESPKVSSQQSGVPPPPKDEREPDEFKLFVGNLPGDILEDEIQSVFSTYGNVRNVLVLPDANFQGLRCGFVFYDDAECCEDAISVLHDKYKIREDAAWPIKVRWANDKVKGKGKGNTRFESGKSESSASHDGWQYESRNWEEKPSRSKDDRWDHRDRERDYERDYGGNRDHDRGYGGNRDHDRGYGGNRDHERDHDRDKGAGWKSSSSRSSSWQDNGWKDSGWQNNGWSSSSSNWRNDDRRGGDKTQQDRSSSHRPEHRDMSRAPDRSDRGDRGDRDYRGDYRDDRKRGAPPVDPDEGKRLFVASLPPDIKEAAIEYVFSTYGEVVNVHIMNKQTADGHIAALVDYTNVDDADTAILSLNGKYEIRPDCGAIQVRRADKKRPKYKE